MARKKSKSAKRQGAEAKEWNEANKLSPFIAYMKDDPGEDRSPDEIRSTRQATVQMTGIAMKEYWTPFDDYGNVEVAAGWSLSTRKAEWRQLRKGGAPHRHGLEIEHTKGYIHITEKKPIVGVTVMGSGCTNDSYVVCEYPQPGLTRREPSRHGQEGWNMQNLRRQYVRGLYSQHQSRNVATFGEDEITYDDDYEPRVYETSVHFDIEPTTTVIIRGGSGQTCHFSFRMIRTYFRLSVD